MRNKKSIGINVWSVLVIVIAVANIIYLIYLQKFSFIGIVFNLFLGYCGIGLLLLKEWGRKTIIIIFSLLALLSLISLVLFRKLPLSLLLFAITLLFSSSGVYFFSRHSIKEQYLNNKNPITTRST